MKINIHIFILLSIIIISSIIVVESKRQHGESSSATLGNCSVNQIPKFPKIKEHEEINVLTPEQLLKEEREIHERYMKLVLELAKSSGGKKFTSIIVSPDGRVLCSGSSSHETNAILHSEIVAITNCSSSYSLATFENHSIYSTAEPDSLAASAILWSRFKVVVWGSSVLDLYCKHCIKNIPIQAKYIFSRGYTLGLSNVTLIGSVLKQQTDENFGSHCNILTANSHYTNKPLCKCKSDKSYISIVDFDDGNIISDPILPSINNDENEQETDYQQQQDSYKQVKETQTKEQTKKKLGVQEKNKNKVNGNRNNKERKNKNYHSTSTSNNNGHSHTETHGFINGKHYHHSEHSHKDVNGNNVKTSTSTSSSGNGHASASASSGNSFSHSSSPRPHHNNNMNKKQKQQQ